MSGASLRKVEQTLKAAVSVFKDLRNAPFYRSAHGQILFQLSDIADVTFQHDSNGVNDPFPIPSGSDVNVGGSSVFSWGSLDTDTTPNTAIFSSGTFEAIDWGGDGQFRTDIDVSGVDEVRIDVQYDAVFGASEESSQFFYNPDFSGFTSFGNQSGATSLSNETISLSVDVTGVSTLRVGFEFNFNGGSDSFGVDQLDVTAIPEPSTYAALAGLMACAVILIRRFRENQSG